MTKDEFGHKYKHEMFGWVCDAAVANNKGAGMSLFLSSIQAKIKATLDEMYADLTPAKAEPVKMGTATIPITKGR